MAIKYMYNPEMGIKHLKTLVHERCPESITLYGKMSDFVLAEKKAKYQEILAKTHEPDVNLRQQLRKEIELTPYIIGIDSSIYISRYKRVFKRIEFGFLRQIMLALSAGVVPVYVFDGPTPKQKRSIVKNRTTKAQNARIRMEELQKIIRSHNGSDVDFSKYSIDDMAKTVDAINSFLGINSSNILLYDYKLEINPESDSFGDISSIYEEYIKLSKRINGPGNSDIEQLKSFLDVLGIPHLTAEYEADDLLVNLWTERKINAIQSDDMDMLPKGCGNLIQVTTNGIYQLRLDRILSILRLDQKQFIDLCILLGSDYYMTYLPKLKWYELLDLFQDLTNPCIEEFIRTFSKIDPNIVNHQKYYLEARSMFLKVSSYTSVPRIEYKIRHFDSRFIWNYFESVGIELSKNDLRKIQSLIPQINRFINS